MKRLFTAIPALLLLAAVLCVGAFAAETEARELKITASPLDDLSWDGVSLRSYYRALTLKAGTPLTLTPAEPGQEIWGLYVVWETAPGSWTLSYGDKSVSCGENGFLHEFVPVEGGAEEVTLTVRKEGSICFVRAFGPGTLPSDVQIWEPPCEKADILLFPTHADDEILFFGGVLAQYAGQQGLAVQVAYFTHYPYGIREHEKLDGIWTCGVRNYPVNAPFPDVPHQTPDQARGYYGTDKPMAFYMEQIRRFRPQVCIAHDVSGEYGHGAHQFTVQIIREALEQSMDASADPESAEAYGTWDVPKTYLHLWKENPIQLDCRQSLSAFGGRTALEVAAEAYKKHVTQQQYWFSVSDEGPYSLADFGLYRTTVGPDTGNDIMEHIVPYAEQAKQAALAAEPTQPATVPETAVQPTAAGPSVTGPAPTRADPAQPPPARGTPLSGSTLIFIAVPIVLASAALAVSIFRGKNK